MKKSTFKERLDEIHKLANRIPKTVKEAVYYEDDEEMAPQEDELAPEEPVQEIPERPMDEEPDLNPAGKELVDKIRKVSLQGMADLADTPEIPEYEILKKIWQICDKALVQKKEEEKE